MALKSGSKFLGLLLGAMLWTCLLSAQETPLRLGGRAFILPEDWPHQYDPPEVLFRAKVNPDSTLGLVRVLDGKTELEPLINQHLAGYEYVASTDSLSTTEFDAILDILQAPETTSALDKKAQATLLQEIEDWIDKDRESLNFHQPARSPSDYNGLNAVSEPYRSGFYFVSLPEADVSRTLNGFQQRESFYLPAYADLQSLGFLQSQDSNLDLAYESKPYPYQVTLSEIEVGIGDYEQLFARGALRKNRLFGVERLQLGFSFLIQDGTWLGRDSGREALALDLSVPLGKSTLDLGFADHRTELSQRYLRPEYWRSQDFSVERRYSAIYAAWKSPWLNLALLNETDSSEADVFRAALHNDALRLQAWETVRFGILGLTALYERVFANHDSGNYPENYTDFASLKLRLDSSKVKAQAKVDIYDFENLQASADLAYSFGKLSIGTIAALRYNDSEPRLWVPGIYDDADSLRRVGISEKQNLGLYLNWHLGHNSMLSLGSGRRWISNQYGQNAEPAGKDIISNDQSLNYLRLGAKLDETWGKWNLSWQPGIIWQGGYAQLFEEPVLRYQSHLNLRRLLTYDNALFTGFSLLGHSSYLEATPAFPTAEASLIMDVWVGVQISKRFEFQISYKNLLNSGIYGTVPLNGSMQASLRWYFLN